jgi:hypothetical protein
MSSNTSFTLIPTELLNAIESKLSSIGHSVDNILASISHTHSEPEQVLSTKESMALLKFQHINTFKAYLKRNNIPSIDDQGPKRYLRSRLLTKSR